MWTEPISFWGNEKLNFVIPIKSLDEEKEIESILFFDMDSLSTDYFVFTREKVFYILPIAATSENLTYQSLTSNDKLIESYHTHSKGSPIPSWSDLKVIATLYKEGKLDVNNFSYGIIIVIVIKNIGL